MLGGLLRALSSFAFGVALARLLPPEDFGIVAMATLATSFAYVVVADMGLGMALVQRPSVSDRHVRVAHTVSLTIAAVITAVLCVGAGTIADFFNDPRLAPVLVVLATSFLLSGFSITAGAILMRRLAFRALFGIELAASVVGFGAVGVAMAVADYGYWSLVGGTIAQAAISSSLTYAAVRHSLRPLVARAEIRDLLGFSIGMSLTSVVNYFALRGDYFVVGRLMTATSVGLYSRAYALMELPLVLFGTALSRVLFPAAARVQHDAERFRRAYLMTMSVAVAVSLPVSLALAVLAPELIRTLYGAEWMPAAPLLQILSLFGMFRMTYNTASAFLRARGQVYPLFGSTVLYGSLVVGGAWVAATRGGLDAAAWAVGGALTAMWLLVVGIANRSAAVTPGEFVRMLCRAALPGTGVTLILLALTLALRAGDVPPQLRLLVAGGCFAAALSAVLVRQLDRLDHPAATALVAQAAGIHWRLRRAMHRVRPAPRSAEGHS